MGAYVIAIYKPKPGQDAELLACVRAHLPILRQEDLVTEREALVLRAPDGALLEIVEWKSQDAVDAAHHNAAVRALWARFDACCTFGTLAALPGADGPFPHFALVEPELA
jgi:quinol monooxygenase YgiN